MANDAYYRLRLRLPSDSHVVEAVAHSDATVEHVIRGMVRGGMLDRAAGPYGYALVHTREGRLLEATNVLSLEGVADGDELLVVVRRNAQHPGSLPASRLLRRVRRPLH